MADIQTNSTADTPDKIGRSSILKGDYGIQILHELQGTGLGILDRVDRGEVHVNACFNFYILAPKTKKMPTPMCCICSFVFLQVDGTKSHPNIAKGTYFGSRYEFQENAQEHYKNAYYIIENSICRCLSIFYNLNLQEAFVRTGQEFIKQESLSLLHAACGLGKTELVAGLIKRGADVNIQSGFLGAPPLYFTLLKVPSASKINILSQLLKAGCHMSPGNRWNGNILHTLMDMSHKSVDYVDCFRTLMLGKDFRLYLYHTSGKKETNQSFAREKRFSPFQELCTAAKIPEESQERLEDIHTILTHLHINKFLEGFLDECCLLIEVSIPRHINILKILLLSLKPGELDRKEVCRAFVNAVAHALHSIVKVFLKYGVDPNNTTRRRFEDLKYEEIWKPMTPLWVAASNGDMRAVKMLIEKGADVNKGCGDGGGYYAIVASMNLRSPVAKYLLAKGAKPELPNMVYKHNALHAAAKQDRPILVSRFLEMGVRFDEQDEFGYTPFLWAISQNNIETAKVLFVQGANVKVANEMGATALHYCLSNKQLVNHRDHLARMLIERGADINALDNTGCSPFWYAMQNYSDKRRQTAMLLRYNPDLNNCWGRGYDRGHDLEYFDDMQQIQNDGSYPIDYYYEEPKTIMEIVIGNGSKTVARTLAVLGCELDCDLGLRPDDEFECWLNEFETNPQSLSNLCRITLRNNLPSGKDFHTAVESLGIPNIIKDFIIAEGELPGTDSDNDSDDGYNDNDSDADNDPDADSDDN